MAKVTTPRRVPGSGKRRGAGKVAGSRESAVADQAVPARAVEGRPAAGRDLATNVAGGRSTARKTSGQVSPRADRVDALRAVMAARSGDGPFVAGGKPSRSRELRRQGRETLVRLLEAAIVVFDERGYGGARVDDIVRRAETSHGTFYLYFSNKEDLFDTLIIGVTEEMRQLAVELPSVSPGRRGYDELREWVGRFYDVYAHYYPVIRSWTELNQRNTQLAAKGAFVLRRFIDELVARVREIEPIPVADPETAAMAMLSMVERATFYALVGLVPVDRENLLDHLASILHIGLFGGARRRPVHSASPGAPVGSRAKGAAKAARR